MSPTHNESSVLQRFEHSNAIEIRNRIMFDFPQDCHICKNYLINPDWLVLVFTEDHLHHLRLGKTKYYEEVGIWKIKIIFFTCVVLVIKQT